MSKTKHIEEGIRERVLQAVDELYHPQDYQYKDIMDSIGEVQQVHTQFKKGTRYPTLKNIVLLNYVHGYSLKWIMTGQGPKKDKKEKDPEKRLDEMENELKGLRAQFKARK